MQQTTAKDTLTAYLIESEWDADSFNVVEIGDELHVTVANNALARAMLGTMTAYGDYEITDVTRMVAPFTGNVVSVTITATQN